MIKKINIMSEVRLKKRINSLEVMVYIMLGWILEEPIIKIIEHIFY